MTRICYAALTAPDGVASPPWSALSEGLLLPPPAGAVCVPLGENSWRLRPALRLSYRCLAASLVALKGHVEAQSNLLQGPNSAVASE